MSEMSSSLGQGHDHHIENGSAPAHQSVVTNDTLPSLDHDGMIIVSVPEEVININDDDDDDVLRSPQVVEIKVK
jgi:hypothetical protein